METIKVISHLQKPLRGRYNGKDYDFLPEKPTLLPIAAADHIFGLGEDDKSGALNRLGLLIPGRDTLEEALKQLDQIAFLEGQVVFADELAADDADLEDQNPTPARRAPGGKKTAERRPHVGPGPETAGASAPAGDGLEGEGAPSV